MIKTTVADAVACRRPSETQIQREDPAETYIMGQQLLADEVQSNVHKILTLTFLPSFRNASMHVKSRTVDQDYTELCYALATNRRRYNAQ